jgi:hypothetical protein
MGKLTSEQQAVLEAAEAANAPEVVDEDPSERPMGEPDNPDERE